MAYATPPMANAVRLRVLHVAEFVGGSARVISSSPGVGAGEAIGHGPGS